MKYVWIALLLAYQAKGQGTINVASGNITDTNHNINYVLGGEVFNSLSNNSYTIIPSSITLNYNLVTEIFSEKPDIQVYPNPFTDKVFINLPSIQTIELLDAKGIILKTTSFRNGEFDCSELPQGMYFMRFSDKNSSNAVKIIKYDR